MRLLPKNLMPSRLFGYNRSLTKTSKYQKKNLIKTKFNWFYFINKEKIVFMIIKSN